MKALILAGGFGTRLGELTKDTPKPMLPIGNKSVLEHIVDKLKSHGIDQIFVKVHYLPYKILEGIGDKVVYYYEPILFSHFDTLMNMQAWFKDEDFLVLNGDTMSDVNLTEMIASHKPGTITVLQDEWRCAGVWIYPKEWYTNKEVPIHSYRPKLKWWDIGVPERLKEAREYYEK